MTVDMISTVMLCTKLVLFHRKRILHAPRKGNTPAQTTLNTTNVLI